MFFQIIFIFFFCVLLAFVEVQIEGRHGWAAHLPTWRPRGSWYAKLYQRIMSGKSLTGYHIGMFSLVLFVLHGFYFWNGQWSWQAELEVVSYFFLVSVVWDFLWFVLNPHYGWRRFKPAFVAWHKPWLGPLPVNYYEGVVLFFVLYSLSLWPFWLSGFAQALYFFAGLIALVAAATFVRFVIDSLVKKQDRHA